jgi:hypothetical protein
MEALFLSRLRSRFLASWEQERSFAAFAVRTSFESRALSGCQKSLEKSGLFSFLYQKMSSGFVFQFFEILNGYLFLVLDRNFHRRTRFELDSSEMTV